MIRTVPLTRVERKNATNQYEILKKHIRTVSDIFKRKNPNISDHEIDGTVDDAYLEAVLTYDGKSSQLKTWVSFKIDKALRSLKRDRLRKSKILNTGVELQELPEEIKEERFWLDRWLEGMSDDVRLAVSLVFEMPLPLRATIAELGGYETPQTIRQAVREYMRDLGWDENRISDTFRSIKEAL